MPIHGKQEWLDGDLTMDNLAGFVASVPMEATLAVQRMSQRANPEEYVIVVVKPNNGLTGRLTGQIINVLSKHSIHYEKNLLYNEEV